MFVVALALPLIAPPSISGQTGTTETALFCGYRLALPAGPAKDTRWRMIQNEPELLIYESLSRTNNDPSANPVQAQWLFSCNANASRTSQVSEIRDSAAARGQSIHQLEELTLDREVLAAVFSRTRVFEGNRVKSVEAYFATRDLEYRIFALPARAGSGQIPSGAYAKLDQLLRETLSRMRFAGEIQTTITETEYRTRLYAAAAIGVLVGIFLLGFAFRTLIGKSGGKAGERKQEN